MTSQWLPRVAVSRAALFAWFAVATYAQADIFQWEYINPADASQGKQQSTTLAPDGAGADAIPGANLAYRNLALAYLIGADLTNAHVDYTNLTWADLIGADLTNAHVDHTNLNGADLSQANLTNASMFFATLTDARLTRAKLANANLSGATLTDADFTDAMVGGATFDRVRSYTLAGTPSPPRGTGITPDQLYSTAGYQVRDLRGIGLRENNLTGANFTGQNLSAADFAGAILTDGDFTDAEIVAATFDKNACYKCAPGTGITPAQLYVTASYKKRDLSGVGFWNYDFTGGNFVGQNLTNANFYSATLTDADFTGADVRHSNFGIDNRFLGSFGYEIHGTGLTLDQLYSTASYKSSDLRGVALQYNNLAGGNFARQNLTNANFYGATLTDADFTDAEVRGASLGRFVSQIVDSTGGITLAQLYSTASYQAHQLTGINLSRNSLAGGNFAGQNLTNASFAGATLTGADFAGAEVRGASFSSYPWYYGTIITFAQLYSTASYQAHDLSGINLSGNNLAGGNFAGQNLTNADFYGARLTDADFTGAEIRGASFGRGDNGTGLSPSQIYSTASYQAKDLRGVSLSLSGVLTTNLIRPDGHINGLDLRASDLLVVRDYDGRPEYGTAYPPIPITVDQHLAMGPGGTLRMVFEADAWDSTISFAPGIPVTLGGTLELTFAADVNLASQVGRTFDVFNWTGVNPTGAFQVQVPPDTLWDTNSLYTAGEVSVLPTPSDVTVPPGAWYVAGGLRARSLFVGEDSRLTIAPADGPSRPVTLRILSIAGGATLDLTENDAIVQSTAATKAADLARLYGHVKHGYHGGDWQGTGITSSTAAADASAATTLAMADNALLGYTESSGLPVTADAILLKYTYYGDIDVNGQVDADDLTVFANNFGRPSGASQIDGDIDFNGAIDANDLTVFANNFSKGIGNPLSSASAVAAVPEPATLVLAFLGAFGLIAQVLFGRSRGPAFRRACR